MSADEPSTGWMKLYHPRGPLVTLPVTSSPQDYAAFLAHISAALDAGWLVAAPGLEAGEQREEVGYVVLRNKENEDRSVTPLVDLYAPNEAMKFKILSVYLNTPEDQAAFEAASGLKLASLRPYVGTGSLERGASRQTDIFFAKPAKPFPVVMKDNPKYDPDEKETAKKKPKRLFVRWEGVKSNTAVDAQDEDQLSIGIYRDQLEKVTARAGFVKVYEAFDDEKKRGLITPKADAAIMDLFAEFGKKFPKPQAARI